MEFARELIPGLSIGLEYSEAGERLCHDGVPLEPVGASGDGLAASWRSMTPDLTNYEEQYSEGSEDVEQFAFENDAVEVALPLRGDFYKFRVEDYPTERAFRRELASSLGAYEEFGEAGGGRGRDGGRRRGEGRGASRGPRGVPADKP